jgi:hypothetical protein
MVMQYQLRLVKSGMAFWLLYVFLWLGAGMQV